ncbi:MAG TPA: L,D-transpeptidase family protein [Allosphingosinicella sp.]|nr:L,D-transpeptidase family protein [Allosphingosinicella sp.]
MRRLLFICMGVGLLLGSAAPPAPEPAARAPAEPMLARTVFEAIPGPPQQAVAEPAAAAPEPVLAQPAAPAPRARRPGAAVRVLVSLPLQRLWVFRGRELVATSAVSTGKSGHETPAGSFPILQKRVEHYSNRYDNAPMPYMQRLTHEGIALHGGRLPGYPASHGCIRLPHRFARRLYNLTDHGTRVVVTRARPRSTAHALSLTI